MPLTLVREEVVPFPIPAKTGKESKAKQQAREKAEMSESDSDSDNLLNDDDVEQLPAKKQKRECKACGKLGHLAKGC